MDEPVFTAPWHAQLFAVTVHLSEAGHFSWTDWTQTFGAALKRHGLSKELDGGDDYFSAWLEALEVTLTDLAGGAEIATLADQWRRAYLNTPHGAPVRLSAGYSPSS
jgi:nitrile hydratase accessory protein